MHSNNIKDSKDNACKVFIKCGFNIRLNDEDLAASKYVELDIKHYVNGRATHIHLVVVPIKPIQ